MSETRNQRSTPIPLWLDCDPGHDDAFAILLAAHHPDLRLLGISTVHGNASLDQTTWNALSILTAIGKADVPVHPGATKPFCRVVSHAPDIHGKTGLDGTIHLPEPTAKAIEKPNAVLAMRHALVSMPKGTAWLVSTGTLTNIALLFAVFPEVIDHIKGLSIMGGAIGGGFTAAPLGTVKGEGERFGNTTPWAEFNIYCDPEAAHAVFSDPKLAAKTTLIPLDLTHQVLATQEIQNRVLNAAPLTKLGKLFYDIVVFFAGTYREVYGLTDGPPLHDPIAVAILLDDQSSKTPLFDDHGGERWHVSVETDGSKSTLKNEGSQAGRTIIKKASDGEGGVRIPRKTDTARFWNIVVECLQLAQEAVLT